MRGLLMPIGGAEDKYAACEILGRFVKICGGNAANLLIIPSASSIPYDVAEEYAYLFYLLGVAQVNTLHISSRKDANNPASLQTLDKITGIFISGGDQLKLSSLMGETLLAAAIHERFLNGLHIAGTSAGASIMSREMIAFGRDKFNPSERLIHIDKGLGLSQNLIIDQHFSQRERLERLTAAVEQYPTLTGVGIDENTALIISPDDSWEVIGAGTVTVVNRLQEAQKLQAAVHEKYAERYHKAASSVFAASLTKYPDMPYQLSPD